MFVLGELLRHIFPHLLCFLVLVKGPPWNLPAAPLDKSQTSITSMKPVDEGDSTNFSFTPALNPSFPRLTIPFCFSLLN